MKHAVRFGIVIVAVVLVASGASAQTTPVATVKIDFAFTAAGQAMPAGSYRFEAIASGTMISLRSADGASSLNLPIITRLGRHDGDQSIEVIFDVIKGERLLSEIWLPSGADGYCVATTKAEHTHHVLGGSKPSSK